MWYAVIDGLITFTTFGKSQKVLNLKRDPKITAMLESGRAYSELKATSSKAPPSLLRTRNSPRKSWLTSAPNTTASLSDGHDGGGTEVASKRVVIRIRPTSSTPGTTASSAAAISDLGFLILDWAPRSDRASAVARGERRV